MNVSAPKVVCNGPRPPNESGPHGHSLTLGDLQKVYEANSFVDPHPSKAAPMARPSVQNVLYQLEDRDILNRRMDYGLYQYRDTDLYFRRGFEGGATDASFFTVLGAAQAFGRGCRLTYGEALARSRNQSYRNFSVGGVGPNFYLLRPDIIEDTNRGQFCVVNIMSPRSVDLDDTYPNGSCVYDVKDGQTLFWGSYIEHRKTRHGETLEDTVRKMQDQFMQDFRALSEALHVPTILVNYSFKAGQYSASDKTFPQFLTEDMLAEICDCFDFYVANDAARNQSDIASLKYYPSQKSQLETAALLDDLAMRAGL